MDARSAMKSKAASMDRARDEIVDFYGDSAGEDRGRVA